MKFISTRGGEVVSSASEAIAKGLASDGGLFVPETFPCVKNELEKILDMDYAETATFVLSKFLEESSASSSSGSFWFGYLILE